MANEILCHVKNLCVFIHTDMLGNVARMAGIGEGTGPLSVEVPVERVRQFVYQVG